uniref:MRP-like transporter n=1 Tax=Ganoderma boninense TaxID=34458 RepID=A0A5K1K190_9APHY|nr:MRP-like transporter [Ganoderma boninense]
MSLPVFFAQTAMDFPVDDDVSTGSERYVTARESSEEEGTEESYATPRAHSIPPSHIHVPGSFQEGSGFHTPMSVQSTSEVCLTSPLSHEVNVPMADAHPGQSRQSTPRADLPARDDDDDMHDQATVHHLLVVNQRRDHEDDEMNGLEDSVEIHGRGGGSARAVRQRRDHEVTSGGLRNEVTYWKEVSKYRNGQNKELKRQYAEAAGRWQAIQQQNDITIGKLQEQTAQLMEFMNSSRTTMESELRDKIHTEENRIAAQYEAIQGAQAQIMQKKADQDKLAAELREREGLVVEREAAIDKNRAEVENQQASLSRLLQQARVESGRPRNVAPALPVQPSGPSTQTTLPRPYMPRRAHKSGASTRMFLTAMPDPAAVDSDDDALPAIRTGVRPSTVATGDGVEVHTLTVNQLMEAIRQTLRTEMAQTVKSKSSSRHRRHRSVTSAPESEPEVDRDTRIELLRRVRELYKKRCCIEADKDWHGHQEADRTAVETYNTSGEGAPNLTNIRFDMRPSGTTVSPWNYLIFEHLLDTFKADNATFIGDNNITDSYISDLIEDKFCRGRQTWRGGQPKLKSTGVLETPEECEARVLLTDERLKERARTDQRRRNKFERRHTTVKKVIALHVGDPESDVAIWRFLEKVLDLLGPDGMSSEDTCDDMPETVFRVKVLEWRRPMDDHMEIIDNQRVLDRDLFSRQGSRPGKRLRDGTVKSTRNPVRRLPQQLYNPDWLQAQNVQQIHTLAVSSEKFDWIRVVATLAHTMG